MTAASMFASGPLRPVTTQLSEDEDPLSYLPCATIVEYSRGEVIYGVEQPCTNLYVVIAGTVQVSRLPEQGQQVIVDLYVTDDFFGEAALVRLPRRDEQALALDKTMLMRWEIDEIEELMERRPSLAMAFLKIVTRREILFAERVASMTRDSIILRLARSLLRFSERLGTALEGDAVRMRALTHAFLAQYVGTSREIINACMSQLRRLELVEYSRREITVHPGAMLEWMRTNP